LEQFYPKNFVIDLEGTKNAYEGVVCLPFVSTDNIREVFKEVVLRDYDAQRNKFSKIKVFRRKGH
jgi:5'-3' exonuclease